MKLNESPNRLMTHHHQQFRTTNLIVSFFFGCLLTGLVVGCTTSSPTAGMSGDAETEEEHHHHDHGHRPEGYTAALTQIKHCRDEVKAAFDAGTPNECDDALHVLAEVLDVLPEVAAETDMPKEDWQVVKDQSKVLFDQFMKIHDGFHGDGKQGSSFDAVAETIHSSIEALESKVAATGEKAAPTSSEHDHGDHEGHDH